MPKRFSLPRILGLLAAITCTCATMALAAQVAPEKRDAPGSPGRIVLDAVPEDAAGQLPPVAFDHDLHTKSKDPAETCIDCHDERDAKSGYSLRGTAGKTGKGLENAFHDKCFSCHEANSAKGLPSGPPKAECRSCHDVNALPASARKTGANRAGADGGMDASLHARHVASELFPPSGADRTNCAACHHPVSKPLSPGLKADSCRSCHLPGNARDRLFENPPFADVAHASCISCHRTITASGKAALPVTCESCHDASAKAGYAKLSPPPRLGAGQPDSVTMELPAPPGGSAFLFAPPSMQGAIPDAELEAATQPRPAMPPVVFSHKRHETRADNCISCHHNTMRQCSSCHTPTGNAVGKNITLSAAMHLPTSDRSCVGCHETRKTASPECAGCHAITPKPKDARPRCDACHQPVAARKPSPADPQLRLVLPAPSPVPVVPERMVPEQLMDAAINAAPEKVVIGILADEYEPSVFPHRAVVRNLAEGIKKTSPGMARFHAGPYSLCAGCHHNSPPGAAPPGCVSCHAKDMKSAPAAPPKDGRPLLREAYHRQCMTCHTAMNIKPANTDCASCHAGRVTGREGGR